MGQYCKSTWNSFTNNETEQLQKFFYDKLKDVRLQTRLWRCRGLSLFDKDTVIKSFLLSKIFVLKNFIENIQNL